MRDSIISRLCMRRSRVLAHARPRHRSNTGLGKHFAWCQASAAVVAGAACGAAGAKSPVRRWICTQQGSSHNAT
jgi:hypothetical protein